MLQWASEKSTAEYIRASFGEYEPSPLMGRYLKSISSSIAGASALVTITKTIEPETSLCELPTPPALIRRLVRRERENIRKMIGKKSGRVRRRSDGERRNETLYVSVPSLFRKRIRMRVGRAKAKK